MFQLCQCQSAELGVIVGNLTQIGFAEQLDLGTAEVIRQIRGQQSQRRCEPRAGGDDHRGDGQFTSHLARLHGSRAAEGHQCELARVITLSHAVHLDGLDHAVVEDLDRPQRRLLQPYAQLAAEVGFDGLARQIVPQHHLAPKEVIRIEPSEHGIAVGGRGQLAAAAIAAWAWHRPRALGSHPEQSAGIHVGDGATAGADGVDVHHGDHRLVVADAGIEQMLHAHLAVRRHADIGRRAADIECDDVLESRQLGCPDTADQPSHRARHQQGHRPPHRSLGRGHSATGLHQMQAGAELVLLQRLIQILHVLGRFGAHVGIEAGGAESLVLPVLGDHLVAEGKKDLGPFLANQFPHPLLVIRVEEREQKADCYRLDFGLLQLADRLAHLLLVKGLGHVAVGCVDAFVHRQPVAPPHQGILLPGEILLNAEVVGPLVTGDMEDVAVTLRGQHPGLGPFVL